MKATSCGAILVAALLVLVSATGCSKAVSQPTVEQSVTVTETVDTLVSLLGTWAHVQGDFRTVLTLGPAGNGTVYSHVTDPGAPGLSASFPFDYEVSGRTVALTFENGTVESFDVLRLSSGAMDMEVSRPSTWTTDGTWVRAE